MADHHINNRREIADDPELKPSFGEPIPQPSTVKGDINVFGELAGSTSSAKSLTPERIDFCDSVDENRRNQPKSH